MSMSYRMATMTTYAGTTGGTNAAGKLEEMATTTQRAQSLWYQCKGSDVAKDTTAIRCKGERVCGDVSVSATTAETHQTLKP